MHGARRAARVAWAILTEVKVTGEDATIETDAVFQSFERNRDKLCVQLLAADRADGVDRRDQVCPRLDFSGLIPLDHLGIDGCALGRTCVRLLLWFRLCARLERVLEAMCGVDLLGLFITAPKSCETIR